MSETPLISIVLATFNGELFLSVQLDSLVQQSYPDIEIIIVDDCSTDNTKKILEAYKEKYNFLKVFYNESNLGFVKNFEKGCALTAGKYIALCDQDDWWQYNKIEKMYEAIEDYAMIFCDSVLSDNQLQPLGKNVSDIVNCKNFTNCLEQTIFCRIYGHATLFKKSLFEKAKPFLDVIPHDWWLSYIAIFYGGIKYFSEPLVFYRQHSANLFGVVGGETKKQNTLNKSENNRIEKEKIRIRINEFYKQCPKNFNEEKRVLKSLAESYKNFSLVNNFRRMIIFFKYHTKLLASKKKSKIMQYIFCVKMFVKIK